MSASVREAIDRAAAHWTAGDVDAALACCRLALEIDPRSVDALAHTGTIVWIQGDPAAAEALYLRAHAIAPDHVGVLLNLATLHDEAGDLETARTWIERAEAVRPGDPDVTWRKGLVELAMGEYAEGWRHYEAGLGHASIRGRGPGFVTPPWDGSTCDRLVIWHEQGLGDTVQFVRYAELCRQRARKVLLLCPRALVDLVATCPFVDEAMETIGSDDFDRHLSIMSLPHRFGTTLDRVPSRVPYLFADAALAAERAAQMRSDRLKVGLVWSGNVRRDQPRFHRIDGNRSLPLRAMAPLLALEEIDFYSLQKDERGGDPRIVDWMDEVETFADTAAIIEHLDLVISVDTSVVHVAGAMGKPVWVLSRVDACWRWLRNRPDSPWYPTARVFGQTRRGDWDGVIETVASELRKLATRR